MSCPKLFTLLFAAALVAFTFSCGGGGSAPNRAPSTNSIVKGEPNVLTRESEMAKLEALPKPENLSESRWNELKAAMAALIPEKAVCVPPLPDENVADFAFSRDAEGVGSLSWSYWLRNDYNLDGIVDVGDLSEIASHFGESVEDSPANWIIDTSGDGVIGIADVTGIAARYGLSLLGFSVRAYTSETEHSEILLVMRGAAAYDETGVMHFNAPFEYSGWADLSIVPQDMAALAGGDSNLVPFHPARIQNVITPSAGVGAQALYSAEVAGGEPFTYEWAFPDACEPMLSSEAEANITLLRPGIFVGALTVRNLYGSDTKQFQVPIGKPVSILSVSVPKGKVGDTGTFSLVVQGDEPLTYDWVLTNGSEPRRSTERVVEVTLVTLGDFAGKVTVSNPFGQDTRQFQVKVGQAPDVTSVTPLGGETGNQISLAAVVTGTSPFRYEWGFGNGFPAVSHIASPSVQFGNDGVHASYLMVSNEFGSDYYSFNITTGSRPQVVKIHTLQGTLNQETQISAEVLGSGPITYLWDFGVMCDPRTSTEAQPIVVPVTAGSLPCKLTLSNEFGAIDHYFNFTVGIAPDILSVNWTGTRGNMACWFFADVNGTYPMTWKWTMGLWPPYPPLEFFTMPFNLILPGYTGTFNCALEATNAFGSDTLNFQYQITDVYSPPPP